MRRRRKEFGAGPVAFIDVMSCGLGMVILLFVLLDFGAAEILVNEKPAPPLVENPLGKDSTLEDLNKVTSRYHVLADEVVAASIEIAKLNNMINSTDLLIRSVSTQKNISTEKNKTGDLVGIKVDKARIAIILDVSGSMYSSKIAENISFSLNSNKAKRDRSSKWQQAKSIANWLVEVAPDKSLIKFAFYSNEIKYDTSKWMDRNKAKNILGIELEKVELKGGTDLSLALDWATSSLTNGTQIFLVTDGLPTKFGSGDSLLKKSVGKVKQSFACIASPRGFVSGDCREDLFHRSMNKLSGTNFETNVVLLSLEGDPKAAPLYWSLASQSGGILFTPDETWP